MKQQSRILICAVVAILLALTVCGSLWDMEIAKAIYMGETPAENLFGIVSAYIGVIPTFVGWSFLGASILCLSKKQIGDRRKRRRYMAFAIMLLVLSFFYFCNTIYFSNANTVRIHFAVAYAIGIAVIGVAAHLGYKLSQRRAEDGELLKEALFLAAVSLVTLLIISSTKEIMCRPRFRLVLAMDNADYFRNWWQSGRALKASLAGGAVTDEFASLPSGHSAYAMFAIFLFPALADYVRRLEKYRGHLFALGFIWWAVIALSRLTIGAHYLTDVAIAGLVAIFAYAAALAVRRIYLKGKVVKHMG